MKNLNEKNKSNDRFIAPEKCPVCGQISGGRVCCKKCGIYFFRYFEKQKNIDYLSGCSYFSQKVIKRFSSVNYLFCLFIILFVAALAKGNEPSSQVQQKVNCNQSLWERRSESDIFHKYVKNNQENNLKNNLRIKFATMDSLDTFFRGRECFKEGVILFDQKRYGEAGDKFKKALDYLEKINHKESIALTNVNIAVCFYNIRKYDDSFSYFENALYISREYDLSKIEARALQGRLRVLEKIDNTERHAGL